MKKLIPLILFITLVGCASTVSTDNSNQISLGMTKAQVIEVLGDPARSSANSGKEVLGFDLTNTKYRNCMAATGVVSLGIYSGICIDELDNYEVTFINGKVDSYGIRNK